MLGLSNKIEVLNWLEESYHEHDCNNVSGDLLTNPGLMISWKTTKVEVAKAGDLAYVSGTYEETMTDATGKPVNDHGKYVEIFKKQADGTWKVVADIWNSDLPASAAEKK